MPKTGDSIGPYTLVSKLGRGAFGVVWLAEKRSVLATTKVALKLPNDEDVDLDAVKQEAAIWVHASGHPNVLPIIDADVYEEHVVIVSEYAPDGSLSKWLESRDDKAETVESAAEMTLGILAGLEHLHERGIIHRDLKPDNILLQRETPRLADFGIARILKTTSKSTVATGTPVYMSPEAFDGKRNEQTDIWSVGVIFYQLLVGRLPFEQTDIASLLAAIVTKDPQPLPVSIPESIRKVVEGALRKNVDQRWESASEMRRSLRSAVETLYQSRTQPKDLRPIRDVIRETVPAATIPAVEPVNHFPKTSNVKTLPAFNFYPLPPADKTTRSYGIFWIMSSVALLVLIGISATLVYHAISERATKSGTASAGTPSKMITITKLTGNGKVSNAALSPDGQYVAYSLAPDDDTLWISQTSQTDRAQQPMQLLPDTNAQVQFIVFSPDGKYVYYSSHGFLLRIPITGGKPSTVLTDANVFTFSPDGSQIAYIAAENQLKVANADGSGIKELFTRRGLGSFSGNPSWSPDGKKIAFFIRKDTRVKQLAILDLSSLTESFLGTASWGNIGYISWLPDGSGLIINGLKLEDSNLFKNNFQLWLISFPSGDIYALTRAPAETWTFVSPAKDSKSFLSVRYNGVTSDAVLVSDFK
jgi:serine/threonine protein kinase